MIETPDIIYSVLDPMDVFSCCDDAFFDEGESEDFAWARGSVYYKHKLRRLLNKLEYYDDSMIVKSVSVDMIEIGHWDMDFGIFPWFAFMIVEKEELEKLKKRGRK